MMSDTSTVSAARVWPIGLYAPGNYACVCTKCGQHHIADKRARHCANCTLISLAAERDALKAALALMVYETTHLSPVEEDGSHWCRITGPCLTKARAALQEKTDD